MTLSNFLRNLQQTRARASRPYDQARMDRLSGLLDDERAERDAQMTILRDRKRSGK